MCERDMADQHLAYDLSLIATSLAFGAGVARNRRHPGWQAGVYACAASVLFRGYRCCQQKAGQDMHSHPLFLHDLVSACVALALGACFAEPRVAIPTVGACLLFADAWRWKLAAPDDVLATRTRHALGHLCIVLAAWQPPPPRAS